MPGSVSTTAGLVTEGSASMTSESIPQRTCNCGKTFPRTPEYWHKAKGNADGLMNICKECNRAKAKQWADSNPEKVKENKKRYHQENAEHIRAKTKKWYRENTERARATIKKHYQENKEAYRESNRRWVKANPDKNKEVQRSFTERKPARRREISREYQHRRRAILNNTEGTYTADDVKRILDEQEGRCLYCGITLHDDYTIDHVIPLTKSGTNWPDNIAIACPSCNYSKNNHLLHEWEAIRGW